VKATRSDELGIDPSPQLRALQGRILNQDALDIIKVAQQTAAATATALDQRTRGGGQSAVAPLREIAGRSYPLEAAATRIGRLPDNDIVLRDANVSRHHAVIIDTGTRFTLANTNRPRRSGGTVRCMPLRYVDPYKKHSRWYEGVERFARSGPGQFLAHHFWPRVDPWLYRAT
jgi:pSer/pThr/pTyr-binding forkhead associated (FHA) protein